MKLFLVRHGETEENVAGILTGQLQGTLTEEGKAQARETAIKLKGTSFAHIYSSDLKRCRDTAEIIKESFPDTQLTFSQELRERNMGILHGQIAQSIDWDSVPGEGDEKKPENGESVAELKTRVIGFIKQLYSRHADETILLVTHYGWIKYAISLIAGILPGDVAMIGNAHVIEIEVNEDLKGRVINL